jgi:hypothetical protein
MRRSRVPSIAPGTFFVAQSWADCITNMAGINLRQPQHTSLTLGRKIVDICVDILNVPRKTIMVELIHFTNTTKLDSGNLSLKQRISAGAFSRLNRFQTKSHCFSLWMHLIAV